MNIITEYFKTERYLNSLLNLSILKKAITKKIKDRESYIEYFKKEGCREDDIIEGLGLKRMNVLMNRLGHPYKKLKNILHIAGTSGKGSVSIISHEILKRTGLKVGLYTSPHLTLLIERMKIGDLFIAPEDFIKYLKLVKKQTDNMYEEDIFGPPSYHETIFSTALLYFQEEKPDLSVIETGLGWRNDYTMVIPPSSVSVITNISFDHTDYLGDSIESIASNKGDIISEKSICVTGAAGDALEVIKKKGEDKNNDLIILNRDFSVTVKETGSNGSIFDYTSKFSEYKNLHIPLIGEHQVTNSSLAISASEQLLNLTGNKLNEDMIKEGLKKVKIPARLEIISKEPLTIIDGAHNPAKMEVLEKAIKNIKYKKLIVIIGAVEGKDIKIMLNKIVPLADLIITTLPRVAGRVSVSPRQVAEGVRGLGGKAIIKIDPFEALDYAKNMAEKDDLICITGSLYLAGELRKEWVSEEDILNKRNNFIS